VAYGKAVAFLPGGQDLNEIALRVWSRCIRNARDVEVPHPDCVEDSSRAQDVLLRQSVLQRTGG